MADGYMHVDIGQLKSFTGTVPRMPRRRNVSICRFYSIGLFPIAIPPSFLCSSSRPTYYSTGLFRICSRVRLIYGIDKRTREIDTTRACLHRSSLAGAGMHFEVQRSTITGGMVCNTTAHGSRLVPPCPSTGACRVYHHHLRISTVCHT
jgi:hypothetical protein